MSGIGAAYVVAAGARPHELAVGARGPSAAVRQVEVVAERERRQRGRTLPRRAERGGQRVAAVVAPGLVRALEPAVAEAAQEDVPAVAKDREVGQAVAVDVDRVGAGDAREVGDGVGDLREPQGAADRALVPVERGRVRPRRRSTGRACGRRRSRTSPRRRPRSTGTRRRRRGRCPRRWTPRRSGGPPPPSRRRSSAPGRPPGRRRARPAPRRPRRAPATTPSARPRSGRPAFGRGSRCPRRRSRRRCRWRSSTLCIRPCLASRWARSGPGSCARSGTSRGQAGYRGPRTGATGRMRAWREHDERIARSARICHVGARPRHSGPSARDPSTGRSSRVPAKPEGPSGS